MAMEVRRRPTKEMTPFRPFREMQDWMREMDEMFNWPLPTLFRHFPGEEGQWMPVIDMYETDDKFVIKAELPGMRSEDIDISVSDSMLTIRGERKTESEVKEENVYRSERAYGRFMRSIQLPGNADTGKVQASYENGILEIDITKTAEAQPKKIPISARK